MKNVSRINDERHELINTIAHEVIWDWDIAQDSMWWNDYYYNYFGFARQETVLQSESWKSRILQEDRHRVIDLLNNIIRKGQSNWATEYRFLKANFTILNIYSKGTVFYNAAGKAVRIVGSMIDVSEQKKTEQDLRKRNGELHDLSTFLQQEREKENNLFAYEMHEQLGQELAGMHLRISSVREQLSQNNKELSIQVEEIEQILKRSINKVRRISSELFPSILEDIGLAEALELYGQKIMNAAGIQFLFYCEEEITELPAESQVILYRTFQQALSHSIQHLSSEVICSVRREHDTLALTVCDNGRNFMKAEEIKFSISCLAMKERLARIQGSMEIDIDWQEGTTLLVNLPIPKN